MNAAIAALQILPGRWKGLRPEFRLLVGVLAAVIIVTALLAALLFPRSTLLFAAPLESEQLAQIDAQLAAWNVAHLTSAENIMVDAGSRDTILLRLSLAGLPRSHISGSGETLAKASALTPEALLEVQSRTGLAGDIAVALRGIAGIADAGVVIAPAHQGAFTDEASSQASASVRLSLRPGVVLSAATIEGIIGFVSSAVPSLERSHVVLLDDRGVALGGAATHQDDAEATRLALQSAFDSAFGTGATIVRVHAVYAQREEHLHEIDHLPVSGSALDVRKSDEQYHGHEKEYAKHESTESHGSIERDRESTATAGALSHLSVAVLVDESRHLNLEKLRKITLAATGMEGEQGDAIHVEAVHFTHPDLSARSSSVPWIGMVLFCLPYAVMPVVLIIVLRLLPARPMRLPRNSAGIAPSEALGFLADEPPHTAAAMISALPADTAAAVLDLYPSEQRGAIVARMTQRASAFAPTWAELSHVP
jgi:flagellar biosynthesis/type III secretory pathway M-ring protein FliF/YscJ